jgi:NAD(P)-dependent dehydrogenase (short-subunit alcohol dehydrogenase family)
MADVAPTALVTGASRGIGRAVASRFARAGFSVWALARSAEELLALQRQAPERIRALAVDVADEAALRKACAAVRDGGGVRVLVNNAGIAVSAPLHRTAMEDYDRIMAVNVRAPFVLCQELVPGMVQAGGGRVINIASTAAVKGFKYTSAYCASKHALLGLTRSLAVELAPRQVTVNAVCPGWTDTDMVTRSAEAISKATGRDPAEAREALAKMNPLGRLVRPEEVAEVCLFLASEAGAAVTGSAYLIDGGETA